MKRQECAILKTPGTRKILLLFYEPFKSGISRHVHAIISTLENEKSYDFWILYAGNDDKIASYFNSIVPPEQIVSVPPHRFFSLRGFLKARQIIRRHGIDAVHIHNLQSILWGYGGSISAGCRHVVFTPHIDTECAGNTQWLFRCMWRFFAPFTSTLIALSESQKDWFITYKIVDKKKITVLQNHISEKELQAGIPASPAHTMSMLTGHDLENRFVVSQIGRLDRQKNPFFLIRTAMLLKEDYPQIVFLMVGEGPLRAKLEKEIERHKLRENVLLTGHMTDIGAVLQATDVVSLTSRWEGMPYVLLEAACFKKTVVATDIPGNRTVVTDNKNGFLVRSEKECAQKLIALLRSSSLKQRMGETGYKINRHLFNLDNMKEKMSSVYNSF